MLVQHNHALDVRRELCVLEELSLGALHILLQQREEVAIQGAFLSVKEGEVVEPTLQLKTIRGSGGEVEACLAGGVHWWRLTHRGELALRSPKEVSDVLKIVPSHHCFMLIMTGVKESWRDRKIFIMSKVAWESGLHFHLSVQLVVEELDDLGSILESSDHIVSLLNPRAELLWALVTIPCDGIELELV